MIHDSGLVSLEHLLLSWHPSKNINPFNWFPLRQGAARKRMSLAIDFDRPLLENGSSHILKMAQATSSMWSTSEGWCLLRKLSNQCLFANEKYDAIGSYW